MRLLITILIASLAALGCSQSGDSASDGASKKKVKKSKKEKKSADGFPEEYACENETEGVPWTKFIVSKERGEIYFLMTGIVLRAPMKITKTDAEKQSFTMRWYKDKFGEAPYTAQDGTIVKRGSKKLSFGFTKLKSSVCTVAEIPDSFFKNLGDVGVTPGKYMDPKKNIVFDFLKGSQKMTMEEDGDVNIWYYRVVKSTDDAVQALLSTEASSDDKPQSYMTFTLTKLGDKYQMKITDELKYMLEPIK